VTESSQPPVLPPVQPPAVAPSQHAHHMPALDGIRGLAIALVMVQHFFPFNDRGVTLLDSVVFGVANRCWMGVDLFFVLSGFLITGILWRARGRDHFFRNFYMRRVLRIFPAYYLLLAIFFLLLPALSSAPIDAYLSDSAPDAFWHWTYLSNFRIAWRGEWYEQLIPNVFWSLAIEEQFYMVWPAVIWFISRRGLYALCTFLFFAALALRWVLALDPDVNWVTRFVLTPTRMDGLVLGSLLALLYQSAHRDSAKLKQAILACGAIGLLIVAYLTLQRHEGWQETPVQTLRFTGIALASGALVWLCVTGENNTWLKRFFCLAPMRFLGKYSYALYLWHGPADALVRHFFPPQELVFGSRVPAQLLFVSITTLVSIAAALLSWNLLERHCLRFKKAFA
jgi:peptidoglycan/LPS O-acetylase OafA/YrhL